MAETVDPLIVGHLERALVKARSGDIRSAQISVYYAKSRLDSELGPLTFEQEERDLESL